MAENRQEPLKLPQVPSIQWQDKTFYFNGAWLPSEDAALIGPSNFTTLENLRYNEFAIEGVSGYTKINTNDIWTATGPYVIDDGFQFIENLKDINTSGSYNMVHATDESLSDQGYVVMHTGEPGTTATDFNVTDVWGPTDLAYWADASAGLTPRFSDGPQNTVVYCNSEEVTLFSGRQHRIAAALLAMDTEGFTSLDISSFVNTATDAETIPLAQNLILDPTMAEDDGSWITYSGATTNEQSTSRIHGGLYSRKFINAGTNDGIRSTNFQVTNGVTYRYTFWVYGETDPNVGMRIYQGATDFVAQTDVTIPQDKWTKVTGTFEATKTTSKCKLSINSGTNAAVNTWYVDDVAVCRDGYYTNLILLTTRPVRGFYFDVSTVNSWSTDLKIQTWSYTQWNDVDNMSDGTLADAYPTITMRQSGAVTFDHTYSPGGLLSIGDPNASLKYIQELYLYAYNVTFTGGTQSGRCEIAHVSCDPGMQKRGNIWDGVYRQPIQWQFWDNSDDAFKDYTLHVNQSSDTTTPVGGEVGQMTSSDYWICMFEEKVTAIRYTMLGDLINTNNPDMRTYYWNGFEWTKLTKSSNQWVDGTAQGGVKTLAGTGTVQWSPPSDEKKQTLFNSTGYAYKFDVTGTLSGTDSDEVVIDLAVGIPALDEVLDPFDFSALFKDRLMLGSFSKGNEGNRMDYSFPSAPDVWNGFQTSDEGIQALRFGGPNKLTGAVQLYNRFGASVFSMLLVFKHKELYMLVGNDPTDFETYTVSSTIGCPAPHTIATAELGLEVGNGLTRNIAMWVSHSGPMMFDGAILKPIKGVEAWFDPDDNRSVDWTYMHKSRGWVDLVRKEYNILLPSGEGASEVNTWLVYDLMRKKWFRKTTGTADKIVSGWNVSYSNAKQVVFAGLKTGNMMELERGTSWGGVAIHQKLKTGDFWPSENIWDVACVRKYKLYTKRMEESNVSLYLNYYLDTQGDTGSSVTFQDQTLGVSWVDQTDGVSWADAVSATTSLSLSGTQRIIEYVKDFNRVGWAHALQLEVDTSSTKKGFEPVAWGIRYYITRKGDQAS